MTAFEEYCVPVFTDLPAAELTLLGDQLASGFRRRARGHALRAGLGCRGRSARGPVGLGAIQAGRVTGAGQVIAIDPIKYRREFALKMGATIDARSCGRRRRPGRARARAVQRDRTTGDSRAASAGDAPAMPSWRAAQTSSSRPRGSRRFRRRSRRSPIPTNVKTVLAGVGLHAHGRTRDADGFHAASRSRSRDSRWRCSDARFIPGSRAACT